MCKKVERRGRERRSFSADVVGREGPSLQTWQSSIQRRSFLRFKRESKQSSNERCGKSKHSTEHLGESPLTGTHRCVCSTYPLSDKRTKEVQSSILEGIRRGGYCSVVFVVDECY